MLAANVISVSGIAKVTFIFWGNLRVKRHLLAQIPACRVINIHLAVFDVFFNREMHRLYTPCWHISLKHLGLLVLWSEVHVQHQFMAGTAFCLHVGSGVPTTRRSMLGDCAFPVAAARAWNALLHKVSTAPSLSSFKRLLKTHLFRRSSCSD